MPSLINIKNITFFFILSMGLHYIANAQMPKKIEYKTYIPDSTKIVNIGLPQEKIKYPKGYKSEWSAGIRIPYRGWQIFTDIGFITRKEGTKKDEQNGIFDVTVLTLELGEKIHPKESRQGILASLVNPDLGYVYGKINSLYTAKLLASKRIMLAGKTHKNNIAVHWSIGGGFVLGMQKPYYLEIPGWGSLKYTENTQHAFLGGQATRHNFLMGFGEMDYIPGITLKNAFHFDIARKLKRKSAIEIGCTLEYFFNDSSMMISSKPQKLFTGLYLSYQFGRYK